MIRTVLWLIAAAVIVIVTIPVAIFGKLFGKGLECCRWMGRTFGPLMMWIAGIKFDVRGKENLPKEAALYVGNHQGAFDAAVGQLCLSGIMGFIAKKEISKVPVLRLWLLNCGCIFIDRGNPRASLAAINEAQKSLENGRSLFVFPEGTRSRGPEMGEFKPGVFRCAIKAGAPVVPFAIDGSYKAFEEKGHMTPCTIKVCIMPPIYPTPEMKTAEMSALAEASIKDGLKILRAE